jgi:hypothetical protein
MANNISVPVEDRDTMLPGISGTVTGPFDASTVTGKPPSAAELVVLSAGVVVVAAAVVLVASGSAAWVVVPLSAPQATASSRVRIRAILLM